MFDITSGPGDAGHGSFGSSDNSNGYRHGRGRLRGAHNVRILRAVEVEMLQIRQGAQSVDIARPVLVS